MLSVNGNFAFSAHVSWHLSWSSRLEGWVICIVCASLYIYIYICSENSRVTSFVENWKHSYLPVLLNLRLLLSWIFYI